MTETLTVSGHAVAAAQAVVSTHSPSALMRPVSSACGMNAEGEIMPFSGWPQRIRASTPLIRLHSRLTTG
ncbi:hypothetical protein D3C83_209850 [compost metagenome]